MPQTLPSLSRKEFIRVAKLFLFFVLFTTVCSFNEGGKKGIDCKKKKKKRDKRCELIPTAGASVMQAYLAFEDSRKCTVRNTVCSGTRLMQQASPDSWSPPLLSLPIAVALLLLSLQTGLKCPHL